MRNKFLLPLLTLCTIALDAEDTAYGWQIPHTPLFVGGYLSAEYDPKAFNDILFDDIALLLYGNRGKYTLLGEIEASDIPLKGGNNSDIRLFVERLHITYDIDDHSTLRIGKFNSDIGFWNLAPINTLTDTTTQPHLMHATFPELTTGILYSRSFSDSSKLLSVTLQHNSDLDKQYNNMHIDRHYALGWSYFAEASTWRLNGGYFHDKLHGDAFYAGIAYKKEHATWTLQSELFTKQSEGNNDTPYTGYIQLTRHIGLRHNLVFRQEFYKDDAIQTEEGISLAGYTYRPRPSVVLKGEYIRHWIRDQNRMVFSCATIF